MKGYKDENNYPDKMKDKIKAIQLTEALEHFNELREWIKTANPFKNPDYDEKVRERNALSVKIATLKGEQLSAGTLSNY